MKKEKPQRSRTPSVRHLRSSFTICIFLILLITIFVFQGLEMLLSYTVIGRILKFRGMGLIIVCSAASLVIGSFASYLVLHFPLRPVKKLLSSMTRLADGHFDERLHFDDAGPLKEMEDTFNTLASELQNTEMLRSDFVNNFSHEFKTPIVSIRGFARLLQRSDLTEEQRQEYVGIIVDESSRLANMATNVLNLTKIENQRILAHTHEFNLSEQLRRCLLLLEKKWSGKSLELETDFAEYLITGDEELLQQVWVNLLDNAIKFSPEGGKITAHIDRAAQSVAVSIGNNGPRITDEQQKRLYDKFWQADTSHAAEGTGIGLSIVKKVVDLHGGQVSVSSTEEMTTFTVSLPCTD